MQARTAITSASNAQNEERGGSEIDLEIYRSKLSFDFQTRIRPNAFDFLEGPSTIVCVPVASMDTEELRDLSHKLSRAVALVNHAINSRLSVNKLSDEIIGRILLLTRPVESEFVEDKTSSHDWVSSFSLYFLYLFFPVRTVLTQLC